MLNKLSTLRTNGVSEEGFTLIELIIVVVIIGILAAIAIPIFMNQQKAAIQAGVKSDVKNTHTNVATALAKTPTAPDVSGVFVTTGTTSGATASAPAIAYEGVVSDNGTSVTVAGGWDDYTVVGSNADAGAAAGTPFTYTFDSTSGKYTAAGD